MFQDLYLKEKEEREIFCLTSEDVLILRDTIRYLYNQAFVDSMTGLKNRNAYEEKLQSFRSSPFQLDGLHVVMIDINGLKAINDNYGHEAGDKTIKIVGKCLAAVFGDNDFCARIGGDEFLCFLYNDVSDKITAFNRLLKVENYFVVHPVSVSIGIAEYNSLKDDGIDSLIQRSDKLMYMKKKSRAIKPYFRSYISDIQAGNPPIRYVAQ